MPDYMEQTRLLQHDAFDPLLKTVSDYGDNQNALAHAVLSNAMLNDRVRTEANARQEFETKKLAQEHTNKLEEVKAQIHGYLDRLDELETGKIARDYAKRGFARKAGESDRDYIVRAGSDEEVKKQSDVKNAAAALDLYDQQQEGIDKRVQALQAGEVQRQKQVGQAVGNQLFGKYLQTIDPKVASVVGAGMGSGLPLERVLKDAITKGALKPQLVGEITNAYTEAHQAGEAQAMQTTPRELQSEMIRLEDQRKAVGMKQNAFLNTPIGSAGHSYRLMQRATPTTPGAPSPGDVLAGTGAGTEDNPPGDEERGEPPPAAAPAINPQLATAALSGAPIPGVQAPRPAPAPVFSGRGRGVNPEVVRQRAVAALQSQIQANVAKLSTANRGRGTFMSPVEYKGLYATTQDLIKKHEALNPGQSFMPAPAPAVTNAPVDAAAVLQDPASAAIPFYRPDVAPLTNSVDPNTILSGVY